MKNIYFILVFISCVVHVSHSQKQANHWFFGHGAGLDFSDGQLTLDTSSDMRASHGSTVISDNNGDLLFYSNGLNVWNRNHEVMPNGILADTGIGLNTMQNCIIVPKVESINAQISSRKYYLFTVQPIYSGNKGLSYISVDMTLDGGLGDVCDTFVTVVDSLNAGCLVTKHANDVDYWLIVQRVNEEEPHVKATFLIYLVDENGVHLANSYLGNYRSTASSGQTGSFSPDGKLLFWGPSLFTFNNNTGVFEERIPFDTDKLRYSNAAFSPNNKVLYVSNYGSGSHSLDQFDLKANDIISSRIQIDVETDGVKFAKGGLQLAPDGKIYVSYLTDIGVINNPNNIGVSCHLVQNSIDVPGSARWCFPNFSSDLFQDLNSNTSEYKRDDNYSVLVSPNPFVDEVKINVKDSEYSFRVFDIAGRLLREERNIRHSRLNLRNLISGVYIIEVWIAKEQRSITKMVKT